MNVIAPPPWRCQVCGEVVAEVTRYGNGAVSLSCPCARTFGLFDVDGALDIGILGPNEMGIVHDHALMARNDMKLFPETFEGLIGLEEEGS